MSARRSRWGRAIGGGWVRGLDRIIDAPTPTHPNRVKFGRMDGFGEDATWHAWAFARSAAVAKRLMRR